jgi:hypothetical protein
VTSEIRREIPFLKGKKEKMIEIGGFGEFMRKRGG